MVGPEVPIGGQVFADDAYDLPARVYPGRVRQPREGVERPRVTYAEPGIQAVSPAEVVRIIRGDPRRVDRTDPGSAGELPCQSGNRPSHGILDFRQAVGAHVQEPDVHPGGPPRETAAPFDRNLLARGHSDPSAVKELGPTARATGQEGEADREEVRVLQKEGSLLGKEKAEAGQVHLLVIHLDLREVRVHGEIQRQALRDSDLRVDPRLERIGHLGIDGGYPTCRSQDVRRDRCHTAGRQLKAPELPRFRQAVEPELARNSRPNHLLVLASDVPSDVQAPRLLGPGPVA